MDIINIVGTSAPAEQGTAPTAVRTLEVIRDEITAIQKQGEQAFMEVGRLLLEAKARFAERGKWLVWLKDNTSFTSRTAQRLMRVASYFSGVATPVSQLGVSKVSILCQLPPEEVEHFLRKLHNVGGSRSKKVGEMTRRELEQAVRQYLEKSRRKGTGQVPKTCGSSAGSSSTVQDRINRLYKDLSALAQLVTDSKGTSVLNETATEELCELCRAIVRQFAPDLTEELPV